MNFMIRVVQPSNFLSVAAATQFHTEVKKSVESGADIVLVDLKNITSLTSSSFIALVKAMKLVHTSGSQLFICSMNEQIRMMFELTGLDQVFKSFKDVNEFSQYIQPANKVEALRSKTNSDSLKLAS